MDFKIRMNRVSILPVPANVAMTTPPLTSSVVLNLGKSNVGADTANTIVDATGEVNCICKSLNGVGQELPAEPCWTMRAAAQLPALVGSTVNEGA